MMAFVLLMVTAAFGSVSVTVTSPANGATVPSPVRINASASSTYGGITGWKIYVDGTAKYSYGAASSISANIDITNGGHQITVKAWDGSGANGSAGRSVAVSGTTTTSPDTGGSGGGSGSAPSNALTFSSIHSKTGWKICSGSCSGGGSGTYYMRQNVSSPSLSGHSTEYHISPTTSFFDLMWYIGNLTNNSTATNFEVTISEYLNSPSAPQAIEYGLNQMMSGKWYKFSTQCSYAKGVWRVWDSAGGHWVDTAAPCPRRPANTWTNYKLQYKRYNGKAVFVAFVVNGQTYYVNKSFYPQSKSGTVGMISVHYQLDGNSSKNAYSAWVDNWTLKMW